MQYNEEFQRRVLFFIAGPFTGFCFVRLTLTGKLIRMCPPIYVALNLIFQYVYGFLRTWLRDLNKILVDYLFVYLFLKNE